MMNSEIINVSGVTKSYYLGDIPVQALKNLSFSIQSGEITFVMGPSGSGKTTLLNLIGGIDSPSEGILKVCGHEISSYKAKKLTKFRKDHLAFVFQFYSLIPTLTVLENVEMILELNQSDKNEIRSTALKFLDMVGLQERLSNFPSQLSGGERQRVAIARALAKNPQLLLVDEPTGQLDQDSGDQIVKAIRQMAKKEKTTVLLVTHDPELKKYADRIIMLRSGIIISDTRNKPDESIE